MIWFEDTRDEVTEEPTSTKLMVKKDNRSEVIAQVETGTMLDDVAMIRVTWDGGVFTLTTTNGGITFDASLDEFRVSS